MVSRTGINLAIVATILLAMMVSDSQALKCYECSSCEGDNYEAETCDDGYDTCMKVTVNSVTYRSCSKQEACAAGKFVQDSISSAWDAIKGVFNDNIQNSETSKPMECCTSNYCNNTNNLRDSPLLLLILTAITVTMWIKT
ncbi:unnamed protein product [Meganyctiphanes norvegica]|uniref:UPAR/Ly6 domain-containing protein n=1 Tax=Meganyctiphanes norvegica TaxID=48144 RepID=A0AAV2Q5Q0_MEGNR